MNMYTAKDTNEMAAIIYPHVRSTWPKQHTRNGIAYVHPGPALLCYTMPWKRVNFCPVRDANPYFHLFEALWMMAGRNDVAFLKTILPRMAEYSDDGNTFYGAYGRRLIATPDLGNQLLEIGNLLSRDPESRRAVASIYEHKDLWANSKDIPCNTQLMFRMREADDGNYDLDMTVVNRSNDAIWGGVTGANIVHMSIFQEYVAWLAEAEIGRMYVMSNNLHVYDNEQADKILSHYEESRVPTAEGCGEIPMGLVIGAERFCRNAALWCTAPESFEGAFNNIFGSLFTPMWRVYMHSNGTGYRYHQAKKLYEEMPCDWTFAGMKWCERRRHPK